MPAGADTAEKTEANVGRRAAAAELLLLASLGHGVDKSKLSRATELLSDVTAAEPPPPELGRARAMLAIARGRGGEAETLLGEQAAGPEGTFIKAVRRLRERRPADAVAGFRAYVSAVPDRVLGHYLLGRALEEMRKPKPIKLTRGFCRKIRNTRALGLGACGWPKRARATDRPKPQR
jgi:hypothetical protein